MFSIRDIIIAGIGGLLFCLCISGLEKASQKTGYRMAEAAR
ncbi:hypothetical protein DFP91_1569 [Pseudorhodoplanes sinuspersici]|nr:hypothetical protein DFP91_1569 [Pseudorhodoplanes sinuspersici]